MVWVTEGGREGDRPGRTRERDTAILRRNGMRASTPLRRRAGRTAAGVLAGALVMCAVAALAGGGATAGTGAGSAPRTASALPLASRAADQGGPRDSFLTVSITPS